MALFLHVASMGQQLVTLNGTSDLLFDVWYVCVCVCVCVCVSEFIDVGKKQRALDALYDVIKSKRHRTWQKIHEPIMEKYLDLCVELKKSHIAKEGLYQYKNICQQVLPALRY